MVRFLRVSYFYLFIIFFFQFNLRQYIMTKDKLEEKKVALSASLCCKFNSLVSRIFFFKFLFIAP